jgi:ribosome biogenesis protein SSF1/2
VKSNDLSTENVPKSFVFKRGKVPLVIQELVQDMRKVMSPLTATNLKEKRSNSMRDFVSVAAPMGVSHFMCFSSTATSTNLKVARIPRGPTLSFKVTGFALMRHVVSLQRRPMDGSVAFRTSPLVVLNNFQSDLHHLKLMNVTFQHMFPALDVHSISLAECRRVVLFHYDAETENVEFRQFLIKATPVGFSRSVKQLLKSRVPDLSKAQDISDFLLAQSTAAAYASGSESEMEDDTCHVTLPDHFRGRGNRKAQSSALKLEEIGPRLSLKLVKVEKELCEGDVLYHAYVQKSVDEAAKAKEKKQQAVALKRKRREAQALNVENKKKTKHVRGDRGEVEEEEGEGEEVEEDVEEEEEGEEVLSEES